MSKSYRRDDLKSIIDCAEELLPTLISEKSVEIPTSFDTNFYEVTSAIRSLIKTNHSEIKFDDIRIEYQNRRISIIK